MEGRLIYHKEFLGDKTYETIFILITVPFQPSWTVPPDTYTVKDKNAAVPIGNMSLVQIYW